MKCDYNCWGCKCCYGDPLPKPKPVLSKSMAELRLKKAVAEARRAGLTVECKVVEVVTNTRTL